MFEVVEDQTTGYTITEYNETAAALAALSGKYGKAVFDVSTKKGLEEAKEARATLRGYRTNLETMRKSIKAPALERCRLIDAEAKDITEKLTALEKPIAQQIEAEEARKEQEKQVKLNAEIERVTKLRSSISAFTELVDTIEPTSVACQAAIVRMKAIPIDDSFQELQPDAQQAKDAALFRLQNLFAQYTASEAEAEQIRIDRAKLAQLEAESAARRAEDDRKAAEERARLQREQDERIAAEVIRLDAEQAEQHRQQTEKDRLVREAQQAEQTRLDALAAELTKKRWAAEEAEGKRLAALNAAEERVRAAAPVMFAALTEVRKWIGDGEFSESSGLPEDAFTGPYKAVIAQVDDAIKSATEN